MANYSNLKAAIAAAIKTNGNQEITGQVLQDVLTSMVSVIGANYTFAGVATPATNPGTPDQNVFYLAMEGGTYTNFNGTVLPAGISLLMWNGTWTSKTVMCGDGGVFDISVYKSSGGTLATFADLAAALDGGNNIPASARKGGMSVKFVQSSDNKYVQYRLMSNTFNTTVTNWQGVDDEPIAGSNNLVKSGGVYGSILNIKINTENTVLCSAIGLGEPQGGGVVTQDNTRAYLYFDTNVINNISIADGFLIYVYALTDGLDGDWDAISSYTGGWATSQVIPELSSSYKGIGIKICKTTSTDTITLDELKDAITVVTRKNLKQEVSEVRNFSEGCYYGENKIKFEAGDPMNPGASNLYDTTRGHVIIPAAGIKRVIADSNHKIYCFGNDTESYQGATNYSIYRGGWSRLFDMQGFNHKYLIMLLCNNNDTQHLSEEELANSVYYECENQVENKYPYLVAKFVGYQLSDNGDFHSLDNKLVSGKKYRVSIKFEGFVSTDFVNLETSGWMGLYDLNKGNAQWFQTKDFNNGKGLTMYGDNTYEFTATKDFFYVRLSDVVTTTFAGNYSQKVTFEFYEVSDEENIETKQDVVQKENIGVNVFGDVMPPLFKSKLLAMSEDLLVTCVGDSLTGAVDWSGQVENPTHAAPGHQFTDWVSQMLGIVNKNKPQNDRLDSMRSGSAVFTKTGTWSMTDYDTFGSDDINFGDFSNSGNTFRSGDSNAQVQFTWDLDTHAKCNIVTTKSIDGVLSQIVVTEGNGKVLVSEDRNTWVEANGFQFLQRSNPTGKTDDELKAAGEAKYERHRRLWMKKASGATGTVTITYRRDNSTPYSSSYLYCWGIERYSYPAIFFDNIGRGGRPTIILNYNISDIFDRHPDLVIFEMPIANEQNTALDVTKARYQNYFLSNYDNSFKTLSNNYQDVPVLVVLPHCRAGYFDDNNSAVVWDYYGTPETDLPSYYYAKECYAYLKSNFASIENASIINLLDYMLDECVKNFGKINVGLGGNVPYGYTVDSIHLSKYGAQKYVKYLAPIFYI